LMLIFGWSTVDDRARRSDHKQSRNRVRIPFHLLLSWEQAVAIELSQVRKVNPSSFHALLSRGI